MQEVKIVLLTNGDQFIAKVEEKVDIESGSKTLRIENAVRMIPGGQGKMAFQPWVIGAVQTVFTIDGKNVLTMADPIQEIATIYANHTSVLKSPPPAAKMSLLNPPSSK